MIKKGLGAIFKPLFFSFPSDNNNYVDDIVDTQFMVGENLMSAPIIEKGTSSRNVYLTSVNWYDFHTGTVYKPGTVHLSNIEITDLVPLFMR